MAGDLVLEGDKPVMVGDDATQPFPDALLGIQFERVGRLRIEHQTARRFTDDLHDGGPRMLRPPVMDDQQPFPWIIGHQVVQEQRKLGLLPRTCRILRSRLCCRDHQDITTVKSSINQWIRKPL
jgi:hypothetical protein